MNDKKLLKEIADNTRPKVAVDLTPVQARLYYVGAENAMPYVAVPENEVWRVKAVTLYCALATRAGNLYVRYAINGAGNFYFYQDANAANDQVTATWAIDLPGRELAITTGVGAHSDENCPLPDVLLEGGDVIYTGWALAAAPGTVAVTVTILYERSWRVSE